MHQNWCWNHRVHSLLHFLQCQSEGEREGKVPGNSAGDEQNLKYQSADQSKQPFELFLVPETEGLDDWAVRKNEGVFRRGTIEFLCPTSQWIGILKNDGWSISADLPYAQNHKLFRGWWGPHRCLLEDFVSHHEKRRV